MDPVLRRFRGAGMRRGLRHGIDPGPADAPLLRVTSGAFARGSQASFLTAGGTMVAYAGIGQLRQEDLGDGEGPQLLLEGLRQNRLRNSEDQNLWGVVGGTLVRTPNTHASPDGAVTADTIADADAALIPRTRQAVSVTGPFVYSLYIRKDTNTTRFPELQLLSGASVGVQLNTQTGASVNRIGVSNNVVEDVGDYWRLTIAVNTGTNSSAIENYPAISNTLGGAPVVALQDSIIVWGTQLEQGLYPTSYVPSLAGPTTALPDEKTWASPDWPAELTTGKYEFDFWPQGANNEYTGVKKTLLSFGGASDELVYDPATDTMQVVIGGIIQATTAALGYSRKQKVTPTLDFGARQITISNATSGNGTTAIGGAGTWPTGVSLRLGGRFGSNGVEFDSRYSDFRTVP